MSLTTIMVITLYRGCLVPACQLPLGSSSPIDHKRLRAQTLLLVFPGEQNPWVQGSCLGFPSRPSDSKGGATLLPQCCLLQLGVQLSIRGEQGHVTNTQRPRLLPRTLPGTCYGPVIYSQEAFALVTFRFSMWRDTSHDPDPTCPVTPSRSL